MPVDYTNNYSVCPHCSTLVHNLALHVYTVDDADVNLCPGCGGVISVKHAYNYDMYLPTSDQCTYTIHCLQKQESKLTNALKQVHDTITKLEVLRELAKEKESKING